MNEFAEEIAFLEGEETEKLLLEREYGGVLKHENRVLKARWWHGCLEEVSRFPTNKTILTEGQGIVKWLWGSFGVRVSGHCFGSVRSDRLSWASALFQFSSNFQESPAMTSESGHRVPLWL